jgi:hypothetical protein
LYPGEGCEFPELRVEVEKKEKRRAKMPKVEIHVEVRKSDYDYTETPVRRQAVIEAELQSLHLMDFGPVVRPLIQNAVREWETRPEEEEEDA